LSWLDSALNDFTSSQDTSGRITRQSVLASRQELLGPALVEILVDAFLATQLGNALLAAKALEHDVMRIVSSAEYCRRVAHRISRMVFSALAGLLFCCCVIVNPPGSTMNQSYSLNQSALSVQLVLAGNN
jgi:hypothetical protein